MKNKRIFYVLFIFAYILFTVFNNVDAATTTPRMGPYYLAEGVGHVDYYITTSASQYVTPIDNASYKWVYTGYGYNPIYMYKTTNFNASNMDIYAVDQGLYAYRNGFTMFCDVTKTGVVIMDTPTQVWDYGEIWLNSHPAYFGGGTETWKQGIIAHEMGHVFGLAHNNDEKYSVMCTADAGRITYTPGQSDSNGINAMYH